MEAPGIGLSGDLNRRSEQRGATRVPTLHIAGACSARWPGRLGSKIGPTPSRNTRSVIGRARRVCA